MAGKFDAQLAVVNEMDSLGERVQTRVREFKEKQANLFDQAVRADLRTTRGMIAGHFAITEPARVRVRVLAESIVPDLEAKKQEYLGLKSRHVPQSKIDQALDEYHAAALEGFNYVRQSGAAESAALDNRIKNLDRAIGATRFIRDGSVAVGAMLIPGAQGVSLASGAAAVGGLGLMITGAQWLDEKSGGKSWTLGQAGAALAKNTANIAVDAIAGLRYIKLGREMVLATNLIQKRFADQSSNRAGYGNRGVASVDPGPGA